MQLIIHLLKERKLWKDLWQKLLFGKYEGMKGKGVQNKLPNLPYDLWDAVFFLCLTSKGSGI